MGLMLCPHRCNRGYGIARSSRAMTAMEYKRWRQCTGTDHFSLSRSRRTTSRIMVSVSAFQSLEFTVIADADEQLHVTEHVSFVSPLFEGDLLGSFDEAALFAKIARAAIFFRLFHIVDLRLFVRSIFAPSACGRCEAVHTRFWNLDYDETAMACGNRPRTPLVHNSRLDAAVKPDRFGGLWNGECQSFSSHRAAPRLPHIDRAAPALSFGVDCLFATLVTHFRPQPDPRA